MNKSSTFFIAGHTGLLGSAILRKLKSDGYTNFILKTSKEVDLRRQRQVETFFELEKPDYVFMAAARVGGVYANSTYRAEFIYDNLAMCVNIIHASYECGVKKLLMLGSNCFIPETKIVTVRGMLNIKDVMIGDLVLTSDGTFKKVLNKFNKQANEKLIKVRVQSLGEITCTRDHPIFTSNRGYVPAEYLTNKDIVFSPEQSVGITDNRIDLLENDEEKMWWDFLSEYQSLSNVEIYAKYGSLAPRQTLYLLKKRHALPRSGIGKLNDRFLNFTEDIFFLLGYFIGNGAVAGAVTGKRKGSHTILFCFNKKHTGKIKKIRSILTQLINEGCIKQWDTKTETLLEINNFFLNRLFRQFYVGLGTLAPKVKGLFPKTIPQFVLMAKDKNCLLSFIKGYFDADGCFHVRSDRDNSAYYTASSSSDYLTRGIQYLLVRLGVKSSITHSKAKKAVIEGRTVNQAAQYCLKVYSSNAVVLGSYFKNGFSGGDEPKLIHSYVDTVTELDYNGLVYDLTVEDNHNYLANNILVHNCIYPKNSPQPISENCLLDGKLEPTNEPYAVAKIAAIKMCEAYRDQHGFNAISVLPCNLYGIGDTYDLNNSHVLPALIRKFHEAKINNDSTVTIWGTGLPRREFLYADDCADACVFLMENYNEREAINVGSGSDMEIIELAKLVAQVVGFTGTIEMDESKPDGCLRKLLNVAKIDKLGWRYTTGLWDGIKKTYEDFKSNRI